MYFRLEVGIEISSTTDYHTLLQNTRIFIFIHWLCPCKHELRLEISLVTSHQLQSNYIIKIVIHNAIKNLVNIKKEIMYTIVY